MRCYDKWWLPKDMENMGYLFEYCDAYCKELYGIDIDKIKLLTAFMNSRFRRAMETGHPKFLSQSAKDSLRQWVEVDYYDDLSEFESHDEEYYDDNQFYWIGWCYAYIHYKTKLSSRMIVKRLPIIDMLNNYYLGHEMSKEVYFMHVRDTVSGHKEKYVTK